MTDLGTAAQQARHYANVRARLLGAVPHKSVVAQRKAPRGRDFIFVQLDPLDESPAALRKKWRSIVNEVCSARRVSVAEVMGPGRSRYLVDARHEIYYRLRKETVLSLPEIGRRLGGKDHTTVIHGIRRHEAKLRGEVYRQRPYGKALEARP